MRVTRLAMCPYQDYTWVKEADVGGLYSLCRWIFILFVPSARGMIIPTTPLAINARSDWSMSGRSMACSLSVKKKKSPSV